LKAGLGPAAQRYCGGNQGAEEDKEVRIGLASRLNPRVESGVGGSGTVSTTTTPSSDMRPPLRQAQCPQFQFFVADIAFMTLNPIHTEGVTLLCILRTLYLVWLEQHETGMFHSPVVVYSATHWGAMAYQPGQIDAGLLRGSIAPFG
jgi:hypothetical protein